MMNAKKEKTIKTISDESILKDISVYEKKILQAEIKLSELPATAGTWKERKKLENQKKTLNSDIRHIENLIAIARSALS